MSGKENSMAQKDVPRPELMRRFELIEWRVYWQGRVNRGDLEDRFKVSPAQASADLRAYQQSAPGNIEYDATEKTFLPTAEFQPKFFLPSADRYLAQLNAIQNTVIAARDTWFGSPPRAAVMPALHMVNPKILRQILTAIPNQNAIPVEYQSLTNTRKRKIAPHALAFDGQRWHVRAWCIDRREFRDFVLTRISWVGDSELFETNFMKDVAWHEQVNLEIIPHPGLSAAAQNAVASDFGMKNGKLVLQLRVALAFYAIKRLNLDLDLADISPERKQIRLLNVDEVNERLKEALDRTNLLLGR
jgi:predicted DNA-binding transcriptional regulator YafY